MTDPAVQRFIREIRRIDKKVDGVSRSARLVHSAIEDGAIEEYDREGNHVGRIGKQHDGTHTSASLYGPKPNPPSAPIAEGGPASITVTWDGQMATEDHRIPMDFQTVQIGMRDAGSGDNYRAVGVITSEAGGSKTMAAAVGEYEVVLRIRSQSGRSSDWSAPTVVEAESVLDPEVLEDLENALTSLREDLDELDETTLPGLRDDLNELIDTTLPGLTGRLTEAEGVLGPLPGAVAAAEQAAQAAEQAATQAGDAASAAQSTANDAEQAALDAAGIAEGKGQVITQVSAPTGARAREENLWVRLPDHKVHIFDGESWVAATDPDLISAAAEAAQAVQDAADAAQAASDAAGVAQDAQDRAEALESAVGTLQTDLAAAAARVGTIENETLPALNSDLATLRDTTIPNLEGIVGPLPAAVAQAQSDATAAGTAAAQAAQDAIDRAAAAQSAAQAHADAQAEAARLAAIAEASGDAADKAAAAQAAAEATAAADAAAKASAAQQAAEAKAQTAQERADAAHDRAEALEDQVGTLQTALDDNVQVVTTLRDDTLPALDDRLEGTEYTLDNFAAERITSGTIDTDRLNANAIAAAVGQFLEINAEQITGGLIQGDQINANSIAAAVASVIQLNASRITSGEIGAERIAVGELAAEIADVIELNAERITGGLIQADQINTNGLAVALATILELDAGTITSGTIDTERLNAAQVASAVGSFLELNAGQITTGELSAERIAVAQLFAAMFAAHKITATEADLGSFAADEGFIADLAVAILRAEFIDAAQIILRSVVDGWATEVSGRGLEVVSPEGEPAIQLGNYDELGMTLYRDGEALASVTDGGAVSGQVLSAADEIYYQGSPLSEVVGEGAHGVVARSSAGASRGPYAQRTGVFFVQFYAIPGRWYQVVVLGQVRNTTGNGVQIEIRGRGNAAGGLNFPTPSVNSDVIGNIRVSSDTNSPTWYNSGTGVWHWRCPASEHERVPTTFLVTVDSISGSANVTWGNGNMTVVDLGPGQSSLYSSGYHLGGAPGTPPPDPDPDPAPTRYVTTYSMQWWRSWYENGNVISSGPGASYAMQGRTPHYTAGGRQRSMIGFESMTSDLSGAEIERVQVRVRLAHSHDGSGGRVRIGTHSRAGVPSNWQYESLDDANEHMGRGSERWITLPSSLHSAFRNGNARGIVLYTSSTAAGEYLYCTPSRFAIRVTYRK